MNEKSKDSRARRRLPRPVACAAVGGMFIVALVTTVTALRYRALWKLDASIRDSGGEWSFETTIPRSIRSHVDRPWRMLFATYSQVTLGPRTTDQDIQLLQHIPDLESVRLERMQITDDGLKHLAPLHRMRSLALDRTGIASLTNLGEHPHLTEIVLHETDIDDEGIRDLLKWPTLDGIAVLGGRLTDRSVDTLSRLPRLQTLWIDGNRFSTDGLAKLSRITTLRTLLIGHTPANDETVRELGSLPQLRTLNLFQLDVTGRAFSIARAFPELSELEFVGCQVTDADLEAMVLPRKLTRLVVRNAPLTQSGVNRFRETHPRLEFVWSPPKLAAREYSSDFDTAAADN